MIKLFSIFLAGLILLSLPIIGVAQSNSDRFFRWTFQDPVDMVSGVGPQQILTLGSFGAGFSIMSLHDGSASKNIQQNYSHSSVLNFTNEWGNWKIVTPLSAGVFAASLLGDNAKFQNAAFTSLQALIMTNITVNAGKFLFARERPHAKDGPYDLDFADFSSTSFPSGHTATAFAFVIPWVMYYPSPITYSLMAIPVGTAIARVANGKHWLSDVAAGASIGFSMAYYLSKKHLNLQYDRFQVTPSGGHNNFSLTLNFSF